MKIIIIGAGKVGYTLAENLANEDYDVTIIDKNHKALEKTEENLDVMCIRGNGVSTSILMEAGVEGADLLIAVTESDEVNMVCCLTAKKLGVHHAIARVRDPEYAYELSLIKEQLGLDYVINPEQAAAEEIARSLSFSPAINVENFAKGRVRMIQIKVTQDMAMVGKKIRDVDRETKSIVLIGVIIRNNNIIVPNGDSVIEEGDDICIIAKPSNIYNFCKFYGIYPQKIKNVMIVGGGRITYYLSKLLSEMGIKIKIIEIDNNKCLELSDALPNTLIINSDGTDQEVLLSENIDSMDAFVAATGMDEENLMSSLIAKRSGVKKVITKISRTNYIDIVRDIGIDTIICPKLITTNHILKYVRGKRVESLYRIVSGQAEIIEFVVSEPSKFLDRPLREIRTLSNVIIATIIRKDEIVVPHGNDVIKMSDRLIIITQEKNIACLNDLFHSLDGGK